MIKEKYDELVFFGFLLYVTNLLGELLQCILVI